MLSCDTRRDPDKYWFSYVIVLCCVVRVQDIEGSLNEAGSFPAAFFVLFPAIIDMGQKGSTEGAIRYEIMKDAGWLERHRQTLK